jgi:SSS family solute:Na+ symporter
VHEAHQDVGDFFLGGRKLGPWMSAFAYGTTYFSAVLFIGYAGKLGWGFGIYTMWIVVGNTFIGTLLAWIRPRRPDARHDLAPQRHHHAGIPQRPLWQQAVAGHRRAGGVLSSSSRTPPPCMMGLSYLFEMNARACNTTKRSSSSPR